MMNTAEATLSVVIFAIILIEHGSRAAGTGGPDKCANSTNRLAARNIYPMALARNDVILQDPRFVGVRKGRTITIKCGCRSSLPINSTVTWYHEKKEGSVYSYLSPDEHIKMEHEYLSIKKVQKKHNGIYFCNFTRDTPNKNPCATELMVFGPGNQASAKSRNTMKDAIIMIQTILIVLFIGVPISLLMEMKKKRTLKIEDHTYEGLEAYQTATYEDIQTVRMLASKTMEGEHPCLE